MAFFVLGESTIFIVLHLLSVKDIPIAHVFTGLAAEAVEFRIRY